MNQFSSYISWIIFLNLLSIHLFICFMYFSVFVTKCCVYVNVGSKPNDVPVQSGLVWSGPVRYGPVWSVCLRVNTELLLQIEEKTMFPGT